MSVGSLAYNSSLCILCIISMYASWVWADTRSRINSHLYNKSQVNVDYLKIKIFEQTALHSKALRLCVCWRRNSVNMGACCKQASHLRYQKWDKLEMNLLDIVFQWRLIYWILSWNGDWSTGYCLWMEIDLLDIIRAHTVWALTRYTHPLGENFPIIIVIENKARDPVISHVRGSIKIARVENKPSCLSVQVTKSVITQAAHDGKES